MDLNAWPTPADVNGKLAATGVAAVADERALAAIAVAVSMLEKVSGYSPFLAGAVRTLYLNPNGRSIELPLPLAIIVAITLNGVAIPDEEWFSGADFDPPFRRLTFAKPLRGARRSLAIAGKPGHSVTLPAEVWDAVRNYAAAILLDESLTTQALSQDKDQIRQENVTYRFIRPKDRVNSALQLRAEALRVFESYVSRGIGGCGCL